MKYLILMFLSIIRREANKKYSLFFFYNGCYTMFTYSILSLMSLLKIDFTIIGMGENKLLNYFVMGSIMSIEFIIIYHFYPPQKVKRLYKNFKGNKILNLFIILALIIFFIFIFI